MRRFRRSLRRAWLANATALFAVVVVGSSCAIRAQPQTSPAGTAGAVADAVRPVSAPVALSEVDIHAIALLLRVEDTRIPDVAVLRDAFASPAPEVRSRAVLAAARVRADNATSLIERALVDPHSAVRRNAAFAAGLIADSALVQSLRSALGDRAAGAEAAYALGRIRSAASYDALIELLEARSSTAPDEVHAAALLAVWRHPANPRTLAAVVPFLTAPGGHVRFAAAYALSRGGSAAAVPALLRSMQDADPMVRQVAARALRRAAADSAGVRDAARAALITALGDPSPLVRISSVRTLGGYGEPALAAAVAALVGDPDGNVRTTAIQALAALGSPSSVEQLVAVLRDTAEVISIRAAALAAVTGIEPARGQAEADRWMQSFVWLERAYAVRALTDAPYADVAARLRRAAEDPDPRVQAEALTAIAAGDTTRGPDALYVQALGSADAIVRANAITALGRHRDPAHIAVLLDAYARARTDRENDAALASVSALGALARSDSAVARSFYFRFTPTADPVVRTAVRAQLGAGTWGEPQPHADRPLQFYEDIVRTLVVPALHSGAGPHARIRTQRGDIMIELAAVDAPLTVHNFITLADAGWFSRPGARWHRVVPNFVLQDGDPRGDGSGSPGYSIRDEINALRYGRGTVGMALSGPDTGGSQFFITHSPQPHLDGGYTVFGSVRSGMDVADRVVQDDAIFGIEVIR